MGNNVVIAITERVKLYFENHVPAYQKPAAWKFFVQQYESMAIRYKEWKERFGELEAYQLALSEIDGHAREIANHPKLSCKKGCSNCCHYEVDSQDIEVQVILEHCKEYNITIDKSYLEEQFRWKENKIHDHPTHSACVFLKDHTCSIYEVRPIACRTLYVFSDPAICDAKKYKGPNYPIAKAFHFPTEAAVCAIVDPDDSKRGNFIEILLKLL